MSLGNILAVASAKGGTGKSSFAANLSYALLRETRQRVILVDLDLAYSGDACLCLGAEETKATLSKLVPMAASMLPAMVRGLILAHDSGVAVLPAYAQPEEAAEITPRGVEQVLDLLCQVYGVVVVDLGTGLSEVNLTCLGKASHIFVMLTPDRLAIGQTARFLETLRSMAIPSQIVSPVLNRFPSRGDINQAVVATTLGRDILGLVPDAPDLFARSLAQRRCVLAAQPRHEVSRHIEDMAARLWAKGVSRPAFRLRKEGATGLYGGDGPASQAAPAPAPLVDQQAQKIEALKLRVHRRLLNEMELKNLETETGGDPEKIKELRRKTNNVVVRIMDQEASDIRDVPLRQRIITEILDEALGLGPLEKLLDDPTVTEIMCNGHDRIYVERKGRLGRTDLKFLSVPHMRSTIDRIVTPLGRRIDELKPMVDARLRDGSRVNAIIPPLALDGPLLTIRKFASKPFQMDDLVRFGTLNANLARFLGLCVSGRLNILISGGTGSGKTTLLNVLSSFIPENERIITIEDAAELQLHQPHVCRLESRPEGLEGKGKITIRDLVVNALRMRPDRIVVGECRYTEAIDMLQAMNTGHDGSLTTIHANSPEAAVRRLETLVMYAELDLPSRAIRELIASAINIIIQQSRYSDGSRKITKISEVAGIEGDQIDVQDIFEYVESGFGEQGRVLGHFRPTGRIPHFLSAMAEKGIEIPHDIFLEMPGGEDAHAAH